MKKMIISLSIIFILMLSINCQAESSPPDVYIIESSVILHIKMQESEGLLFTIKERKITNQYILTKFEEKIYCYDVNYTYMYGDISQGVTVMTDREYRFVGIVSLVKRGTKWYNYIY